MFIVHTVGTGTLPSTFTGNPGLPLFLVIAFMLVPPRMGLSGVPSQAAVT
jgi:hypothetical protein